MNIRLTSINYTRHKELLQDLFQRKAKILPFNLLHPPIFQSINNFTADFFMHKVYYSHMNRLNTIELDHRNANLSTDSVTPSFHAFTTNEKQTLHLIVADGRDDQQTGETIIWPASFASRADTLEQTRIAVLAARMGARVVYVETPGVGIDMTNPIHTKVGHPSARQLLTVASGNFDPLARAQLDAVDSVLDMQDGQEVRFIGYSMGAWAATSMAKLLARRHFTDKQIVIPRIDLIEAVNDQKYNLSDLIHKIGQESQYSDRYLREENDENGLADTLWADNKTIGDPRIMTTLNRRQALILKALPIGIRKGFADSLVQAVDESAHTTRLTEGSIHVWRANESLVARQEANIQTTKQLGRVAAQMTEIYPTVRDHLKGHHHSFVHSIGTMANFAEQHLCQKPSVV